MTVKIEWKPSELPPGTIIDGYGPVHCRSEFLKEEINWNGPQVRWADLSGGEFRDFMTDEEADFEITSFEILSVPKSWYEEFKDIPGMDGTINREGWVKRHKYPFVETELGLIFDQAGDRFITIEDAVRKAFV